MDKESFKKKKKKQCDLLYIMGINDPSKISSLATSSHRCWINDN